MRQMSLRHIRICSTEFHVLGTQWVQIDEPALVMDLSEAELVLFKQIYSAILPSKGECKSTSANIFWRHQGLLSRYVELPFDGIGLDFLEGKKSLALVEKNGFPEDKTLFAGIVNGKNIWRNNYPTTVRLIGELRKHCKRIVIGTSCSLLHVPYTLDGEESCQRRTRNIFPLQGKKLTELSDLKKILASENPESMGEYTRNETLFDGTRNCENPSVQAAVRALSRLILSEIPLSTNVKQFRKKHSSCRCFQRRQLAPSRKLRK